MTRPFLFSVAVVLAACTSHRPTVEVAPAPAGAGRPVEDHAAALSQMGVDAVLWQGTSAEAYWIFQQAYDHATHKLEGNLEELDKDRQMTDSSTWDKRPCAVIVDIDETVLDNSPYQMNAIRRGRTFDQADWKEWTDKASAKACPGALAFLLEVKSSGCEVFYVTNRDVREKAGTLQNLQALGFPFSDDAHLLLMDGSSDKSARRAAVASTHRIVLLVGDQLRDFDEAFKDRSLAYGHNVVDAMADSLSRYFILLPNPMYGTFRDAIQGKGADPEKLQRTREWFDRNGY